MWIFLALLSAVLAASRRVSDKRLSTRLDHRNLGFMMQLFGLPVVLASCLAAGQLLNPFQLEAGFWIALALICMGFYPLNNFLYYQSLKQGELSNIMPIMSLWPVCSLLPGWLLFAEVPSVLGMLGIVLTVAGVYVLGLRGRRLHRPWEPFVADKSSRYTLLAVALLTVASTVDKFGIDHSNALFFKLAANVGGIVVLGSMALASGVRLFSGCRGHIREVMTAGTLLGASSASYFLALGNGPLAYVAAVRSSSSVMGSLLGVYVLREKLTRQKVVCLALILAGGALLALGG